jgi:glycosyltransferase involved in cell wall biosynthesis
MRITIVSTYPPQRCGLAQFTNDLRTAMVDGAPGGEVDICAVDTDGVSYGAEVREIIRRDHLDDYTRAARSLAIAATDLVVIQHEYGIFGGPDGCYVLDFAAELRRRGVPYVVTLHTILAKPSKGQLATLAELCAGASRVTGFTTTARDIAVETQLAARERFVVVPHGAPASLRRLIHPDALRPEVAQVLKDIREGRVLTTFGLIGPGKGLETAIAALPAVVRRHDDVRYVIAGATHPHVARHDAEAYRHSLEALARQQGVADHVLFLPAFLSEEELSALLARTDLFLTPYRSPEQICSGALTFALAAGVPAVSTAYRYALDVLTPAGRPANGVLTAFDDPQAFGKALVELLDDERELAELRDNVREFGRDLLWPSVATRFADVFVEALQAPTGARVPTAHHLGRLVDEIGIIQFARGTAPDPDSGYCVDDAARLAIVACGLTRTGAPIGPQDGMTAARWVDAAIRLMEAATTTDGMHNLLAYDGIWLDRPHLGDHVGRACWALGVVAQTSPDPHRRDRARLMADTVVSLTADLTSLRSLAYTVLGLARLAADDPAVATALARAANQIGRAVRHDDDWHWFEPVLTYDNARLPQALIAAGNRLGDAGLTDLGLSTLDWLLGQVGLAGDAPMLRLVGNHWRHRHHGRSGEAEGQEQPLDAAAVVEALIEAHRATGDRRYAELSGRAFMWFHGHNRAGVAVYDRTTGGCRDGLSATAASRNQGAESTLAYYQALLAMDEAGLVRIKDGPILSSVVRGMRVTSRVSAATRRG